MAFLAIQILNSVFYAAVLFLIAGGLTLIFGVMRIINLAHGSFFAIGAFVTAYVIGIAAGQVNVWLLFLLLPVGALAAALIGAAIEPILLRPFYTRREEYYLLLTFGLLLIAEDSLRYVFGARPLSADIIIDTLGSFTILGLRYPTYNLVVIAVGAIVALFLWFFIYRTKFGVMLRATSQNRRMAAALGLNVGMIYILAFTIGSFMAGLGGAIVVPTQTAVLGLSIEMLILAFVVVVIGGLGSLVGALVGALIVSFLRTAGIQFFPEIELAVLYLIVVAVLLVRPAGLFGRVS
jgi:branched-chain amino acid transport system permease protein